MSTCVRIGASLALALLLVTACSKEPAASPADPDRARLLGAIPPEAVERGVYAFTADMSDELSPGSLLAPIIGSLLVEADLIVETGAPPITLALGVESDDLPPGVQRIDDVVVAGAPDDVAAVRERLEAGTMPDGLLAALAAESAPVTWAGPPPTRDGVEGEVLVSMSEDDVALMFRTPGALANVVNAVTEGVQTGAPPQSPGKPWRTLLLDPEISTADGAVVVKANRGDLPGALLRQLLDSHSLTFLSAGVG